MGSGSKPARRILSLWFPYLATERIWRQRLGRAWRSAVSAFQPLALSHVENNTQRIAALDCRAEALKLRRGMGLAEARAMCPQIDVVDADPQADRRLMESLADWCDRYTPLVTIDGSEGLFLDITGCSHLFGGEESLLDEMQSSFRKHGFDARIAIASTAGAAWAVSRFHDRAVVRDGAGADWLSPLPLAALRLDPAICRALDSVGLRTIGAIMATPRAPLARRFGKELILRLDQAMGAIDEALSPRLAVPELSAERPLAEPVVTMEGVERVLGLLANSLQKQLERRQAGALLLQLSLFRVDGTVMRLAVGLSRPIRAPQPICRLLHERLEALGSDLDVGYGFDLIRLCAQSVGAQPLRQIGLADDACDDDADLALFVDRVAARLGRDVIRRPVAVASHIPERAFAFASFAAQPNDPPRQTFMPREAPLRLLARPECVDVMAEVPEGPPLNFRWRRAQYRIARAEGPQRVAPEWWLEGIPDVEAKEDEDPKEAYDESVKKKTEALTRDYFRVEDSEGRRYWLYRQGLYGMPQAAPRWFLHGIFA